MLIYYYSMLWYGGNNPSTFLNYRWVFPRVKNVYPVLLLSTCKPTIRVLPGEL